MQGTAQVDQVGTLYGGVEQGSFVAARSEPSTELIQLVQPPVDAPTAEQPTVPPVQLVEYVVDAVDGPSPAVEEPVDPADDPGILIHSQAYTSKGQTKVLSMWNSAEPGGPLAYALQELRAKGYLDGGVGGREQLALDLAGALLIAVAALESAKLSNPDLKLDGVEDLIRALLAGEPIPPVELLEQMGTGGG